MLATSGVAAGAVRFRSTSRLFALIPVLLSFAVPASAWADIYKWIDENGSINFSNVPPPPGVKSKNVAIVAKESPSAAPIPEHVATPTEQALLARIKEVERQLQAAKTAAATPPPVPRPQVPPGYSPTIQPPPVYSAPPPDYYADSNDSGYYPGYYPGYAPAYYYAAVPAYAVYARRAYYARPAFGGAHGGSFHGGGHGGRR
jgi:hypothetical protein